MATPVKASSRTQILDAIVEYCQDLLVVVENKITFGVVTKQPNAINTYGANVRFDVEVQVVF